MNSLRTVPFAVPVIRHVARIELPSTNAASTRVLWSTLSWFMECNICLHAQAYKRQLMPTDAPVVPAFDPSWDSETIHAAFDESAKACALSYEWAESIDRKTITVFTVVTAIAGIAPALYARQSGTGSVLGWLALALVGWMLAVFCCWRSYEVRDFQIGPHPAHLIDGGWFSRPVANYEFHRMYFMGRMLEHNRSQCNAKARYLSWAIVSAFVEVLALSFARLAAA